MQALQTAVVGGGIMGACTCLVLAEHGHQVWWYAPEEPPRRGDGAQARAYALSPETVSLLESLGVWNRVAEKAKAVSAMEIYPRAAEIGVACLKAEDVSSDYLAQILGHAELRAACEHHQHTAETAAVAHSEAGSSSGCNSVSMARSQGAADSQRC